MKLKVNDPCHCGSGKKYKKCHLPVEQGFREENGMFVCSHNWYISKEKDGRICLRCHEVERLNVI